jgi:hypothetical protein
MTRADDLTMVTVPGAWIPVAAKWDPTPSCRTLQLTPQMSFSGMTHGCHGVTMCPCGSVVNFLVELGQTSAGQFISETSCSCRSP